jgi:hypothetical protein
MQSHRISGHSRGSPVLIAVLIADDDWKVLGGHTRLLIGQLEAGKSDVLANYLAAKGRGIIA